MLTYIKIVLTINYSDGTETNDIVIDHVIEDNLMDVIKAKSMEDAGPRNVSSYLITVIPE